MKKRDFQQYCTLIVIILTKCSLYGKPLVCAVFRPHPHAHRTHFDSVRRTHSHTNFCARTRTRTSTFFKKNFQKFFFLFFFTKFVLIYDKKWTCGRAARVYARPQASAPKKCYTHAPARTFSKQLPQPSAQKSPHPHVCACGRTHAH